MLKNANATVGVTPDDMDAEVEELCPECKQRVEVQGCGELYGYAS